MQTISPTDETLVNAFTRAIGTRHGVVIEAATIDWQHPAAPEMLWKPVGLQPAGASAEEILQFRQSLLERPQFFAICELCHQRQPVGWMRDRRICLSCAEKHHGTVH